MILRAQIIADGCDAAHDPLINYLRLALTIVNTSDTKSPIAIAPPSLPARPQLPSFYFGARLSRPNTASSK